ncbi:MAG: radical SAM-associated putative lipoprotein [Paludibacter sp.]|nr:radical SAM-associated putative lipoprotein [Bacteroidales bacterium]MCM1069301.1 radical SAM-associated putative lipoprotein [Prevotella sp.]MCM1353716.1 radical SAM-associated putative lipoprotein [Bacteroides sp.]MCM1442216.1 radical SAM-associated putative lipoprotein [Muribaculum sp.]MCM1482178.1 radical SAM-associated putative lipoprotein [Paludibacter sp.]
MKRKVIISINSLLTSLLTFLGFGCTLFGNMYGTPPVECMYGVPSADISVSGHVSDKQGQPLQDIEVSVYGMRNDEYPLTDGIYTDKEGNYNARISAFPIDSIMLIAKDTAEQYAPDTLKTELDYDMSNADNWYVGEADVHADFILEKTPAKDSAQ